MKFSDSSSCCHLKNDSKHPLTKVITPSFLKKVLEATVKKTGWYAEPGLFGSTFPRNYTFDLYFNLRYMREILQSNKTVKETYTLYNRMNE